MTEGALRSAFFFIDKISRPGRSGSEFLTPMSNPPKMLSSAITVPDNPSGENSQSSRHVVSPMSPLSAASGLSEPRVVQQPPSINEDSSHCEAPSSDIGRNEAEIQLLPLSLDNHEADAAKAPLSRKSGHRPNQRSSLQRCVDDTWTLEVVAAIFAVACLVSIVAVLKVYDGHATPNIPYDITLNAIISTLSTLGKSTLLYAVCEAMGQFKWDWYHGRPRSLLDLADLD